MIDAKKGATRYEYDPRGHLIAAMFPDGTTQHRASDAVSNLFKTAEKSDRVYGRGGRLERANGNEYRYDGHGNLLEKVLADGGRWKYVWSPSGRLLEVQRPDGKRVAFAYDALGRRVRKEWEGAITEFVWDGDDLVHERVTTAEGIHAPLVTWIFEPGTFAPVAKFEGRKRYAVVTDHLGTPTLLMTEAGKLAWKAQLDVYGVPREEQAGIARGDATGNPWRYPGQYEDAETGLYYNRFRYYDPESGRYVNEDPIGLAGGVAQYGYIDDPALKFDPLGLSDAAFLIKWAKELSNNPRRGRLPLSKADAQALIDLADELKVEVRASARDLGINGHSANWKLQIGIQEVKTPIPHIHIGEHHVPVEPGFEPKGGCR